MVSALIVGILLRLLTAWHCLSAHPPFLSVRYLTRLELSVEYTNAIVAVLRVVSFSSPSSSSQFLHKVHSCLIFFCSFSIWFLSVNDRSNVIPKYFGVKLWFTFTPFNWILNSLFASLLFRLNPYTSVLSGFRHGLHL